MQPRTQNEHGGVHGNNIGMSLSECFLLSSKCILHIYVYGDTVIGFLILTNHWCLLLSSLGSL